MSNLLWALFVIAMVLSPTRIYASKTYYLGKCPTPPVVEDLDSIKFLGRWFEVERTFALFEATLRCVSTEYYLREDGKLGIRNSGVNALGTEQTVTGHAFAQDPLHPARLTVFLQGVLFPANLTVLHTDYRHFAVLWSCREILGGLLGHTENMWILARKPYLDEQLKAVIYQFLIQTGVGLKGLKMVEQEHCPHRAVKIPEEPEDEYISYKPDLNHNYDKSVGVSEVGHQPHIPPGDTYHGPVPDQHHEHHNYQQDTPHSNYQQDRIQPNYQQDTVQPNYQAEVQVGQKYKPGKAPYPNQGHAQIPHYHDDGSDSGQGGIVYKPSEDDRDYGRRGQAQGQGQVRFKDDYPSPREVDPPSDSTKFPEQYEEERRTYKDRKGLRDSEADESRESGTTKGRHDKDAKEFLESRRRNVTVDNGNTLAKDKEMEYYEYTRDEADSRGRNGTSRRLRRPALEDDLKKDKDTVRFLDLDKRKKPSVLFISTKSKKNDSQIEITKKTEKQVTKRSIKIVFD